MNETQHKDSLAKPNCQMKSCATVERSGLFVQIEEVDIWDVYRLYNCSDPDNSSPTILPTDNSSPDNSSPDNSSANNLYPLFSPNLPTIQSMKKIARQFPTESQVCFRSIKES